MIIKIKYDNVDFSYMIFKNPSNLFERKINTLFDVVGYFEDDGNTYIVKTIPNYDAFLRECRKLNLDSYLIKEHHIISPFNIEALNIVFRSAIRKKYEQKNTISKYEVLVKPVYIYDNVKFIKLFSKYFDSVQLYPENEIINYNETQKFIGTVILKGEDYLDILLQKIYVLFYSYTNIKNYKLNLPNKDRLNKLLKFTTSWLSEDDEFYNFITARLGQNFFGKEYIRKNKKINNIVTIKIGDDRYKKIVDLLQENSTVLDLGCGNGRLLNFLLKTNKKIIKYYGIDNKYHNIKNAKERFSRFRKFKFIVGNILYPDKYWFENIDTVVISDVIEHLNEKERKLLLSFLSKIDKRIIITVPNYDVNKYYWPDMETKYRHKDHKIEYTYDGLKEEIITPFEIEKRKVKLHCVNDDFFYLKDQITYCVEVI